MDDEYTRAIDEAVQRALEKNLDKALERAMRQMMKRMALNAWRVIRKAAFAAILVVLWFTANICFPTRAGGNWVVAVVAGVLLLGLLAVADAVSHHANAAGSEAKRFSIRWISPYLIGLAGFIAALLLGGIEVMASTAVALASLSLAFPALLPYMRGLWGGDVVKQLQQAYAEELEDKPEKDIVLTIIKTDDAEETSSVAD